MNPVARLTLLLVLTSPLTVLSLFLYGCSSRGNSQGAPPPQTQTSREAPPAPLPIPELEPPDGTSGEAAQNPPPPPPPPLITPTLNIPLTPDSPSLEQNRLTLDGSQTNVLYVDTGHPEKPHDFYQSLRIPGVINHNTMGQHLIQETAPQAHVAGLRYRNSKGVLQGWHIVAYGMALSTQYPTALPDPDQAIFLAAGVGADCSVWSFARACQYRTLVQKAASSSNGLIVTQTRSDDDPDSPAQQDGNNSSCFATSTDPQASKDPGDPTRLKDCIYVNRNRGLTRYRGNGSSWAVAKMAGYAALVRQAGSAQGIEGTRLQQALLAGIDDKRVFHLRKALTEMGFAMISPRQGESHPMRVEDMSHNVTLFSLSYDTRPLVQAPAFTAFTTPSDSVHPRKSGASFRHKALTLGFLHEHEGFLGKSATQTLGTRSGDWIWLGFQERKTSGPWTLALSGVVAQGEADARNSPVIEDFGTLTTTSWTAQARYRRPESFALTASVHQPTRTERARIRLAHDEGIVGVRPGRELQAGLTMEAPYLKLSYVHVREPGHDRRAASTWGANLELRFAW